MNDNYVSINAEAKDVFGHTLFDVESTCGMCRGKLTEDKNMPEPIPSMFTRVWFHYCPHCGVNLDWGNLKQEGKE